MTDAILYRLCAHAALLLGAGVLTGTCLAQERPGPAMLGTMKAERILFLGNSITLHGPHEAYGWLHNCGMAASVPEKDYVHVLATALEAHTGAHLRLSPTASAAGPDGAGGEPATIINLADIFERRYLKYDNAPLQPQLAWGADIVVLQCGENVVREGFDPAAFKTALRALLGALKAAGNPQVFVTSQILGGGGVLDEIKQQVCAEEPTHRTFVDLRSFHEDPANFASSEPHYSGVIVGHPGDKGMARIAAALLNAMVARGGERRTAAP